MAAFECLLCTRYQTSLVLCSLSRFVCSLPAQERTISLQTIGQRTKLEVDGVEFLLMKTLSLHLIEGIVDQVDGNVKVSCVAALLLRLLNRLAAVGSLYLTAAALPRWVISSDTHCSMLSSSIKFSQTPASQSRHHTRHARCHACCFCPFALCCLAVEMSHTDVTTAW